MTNPSEGMSVLTDLLDLIMPLAGLAVVIAWASFAAYCVVALMRWAQRNMQTQRHDDKANS